MLFWYGVGFFIAGVVPGILIESMNGRKKKLLFATKKRFYIQLYSFCFLVPVVFKNSGSEVNPTIADLFISFCIAILLVMMARYSAVKYFYDSVKQRYPSAFKN